MLFPFRWPFELRQVLLPVICCLFIKNYNVVTVRNYLISINRIFFLYIYCLYTEKNKCAQSSKSQKN